MKTSRELSASEGDAQWFGHPRELRTVLFAEVWESFGQYGIRALLVLHLTDTARHGMGLGAEAAIAVYGLFSFGVYILGIPGGWIADKFIGYRRAVIVGGAAVAVGSFLMATPVDALFGLGLSLVIVGTALFRPNMSALVGTLYASGGAKQDTAFYLFYMALSLGALTGPMVCGYIASESNWQVGYGVAGFGLTVGLLSFVRNSIDTPVAMGPPRSDARSLTQRWTWFRFASVPGGAVIAIAVLLTLHVRGVLSLTGAPSVIGSVVLFMTATYFIYLATVVRRIRQERVRLGMLLLLFVGTVGFWSVLELTGTYVYMFAEESGALLGRSIPASLLLGSQALFVILLAPLTGLLWLRLGSKSPSVLSKFGLGLSLLGAGFFVLAWGAQEGHAGQSGPEWLLTAFLIQTLGELCLVPIGLSAVAQFSPRRVLGQMMGVWFLGSAISNVLAGATAEWTWTKPANEVFVVSAAMATGLGIVFFVLSVVLPSMPQVARLWVEPRDAMEGSRALHAKKTKPLYSEYSREALVQAFQTCRNAHIGLVITSTFVILVSLEAGRTADHLRWASQLSQASTIVEEMRRAATYQAIQSTWKEAGSKGVLAPSVPEVSAMHVVYGAAVLDASCLSIERLSDLWDRSAVTLRVMTPNFDELFTELESVHGGSAASDGTGGVLVYSPAREDSLCMSDDQSGKYHLLRAVTVGPSTVTTRTVATCGLRYVTVEVAWKDLESWPAHGVWAFDKDLAQALVESDNNATLARAESWLGRESRERKVQDRDFLGLPIPPWEIRWAGPAFLLGLSLYLLAGVSFVSRSAKLDVDAGGHWFVLTRGLAASVLVYSSLALPSIAVAFLIAQLWVSWFANLSTLLLGLPVVWSTLWIVVQVRRTRHRVLAAPSVSTSRDG